RRSFFATVAKKRTPFPGGNQAVCAVCGIARNAQLAPHLSPIAGRGRIPSEAQRSDGIRMRGRLSESERIGSAIPAETPPHPPCFASRSARKSTSPRKRGEVKNKGCPTIIRRSPRAALRQRHRLAALRRVDDCLEHLDAVQHLVVRYRIGRL